MIWIVWLTLLSLIWVRPVFAIYDPRSVPNNKYGIHIIDAGDISKAAELVNSNSGEWGYVTLVITQTDRNREKWQGIFNELRRKKLIPLVRIATQVEDGVWRRPTSEDIPRWADFLNSLNWPVSNRYVIIYNEPNHAKEWGGVVNPEEYAGFLSQFANELHAKSDNFFVLPAGLDAAAETDARSTDAFVYLEKMSRAESRIWEKVDGWNSHSYPNPGFSGSPLGRGKGSIRSYLAEIEFLKSLGLKKDLPIFITETGWQHNQGRAYDGNLLSVEEVAKNITIAANSVWSDERIVAVTPFILNYQDFPFDHFSWVETNNPDQWYAHALTYRALTKKPGKPKQKVDANLSEGFFPSELVGLSVYTLDGELLNNGEYIINADNGDELVLRSDNTQLSGFFVPIKTIEPGQEGAVKLILRTPGVEGDYKFEIVLKTTSTEIQLLTSQVKIISPPALELHITLGWQKQSQADGVTVLLYDQQEQLIFKKSDYKITGGRIKVEGLYGIVPGVNYRVVVIVPGYLPRQVITKLDPKMTNLTFRRFYPLDANLDGAFTAIDLYAILRIPPVEVWRRFFGR